MFRTVVNRSLVSTFLMRNKAQSQIRNISLNTISPIYSPIQNMACNLNFHIDKTIGVVENLSQVFADVLENSILLIKRTFQPSLIRRKRKHGFLARKATKDGIHVLNRRRAKKRTSLCA